MSQINRRSFVGAAALAVSARPAARAVEKVRVGVFGTNHSHVRSKMRALRSLEEFEVVAVHEPDEGLGRRRRSEELFQGLEWVSEDALLSDQSIDMVLVECKVWQALPRGWKVLKAGKHLHLEKPPSPDYQSFEEFVAEARRKKLLLQLGYNYRFHPCIASALDAARKGWLGKVYQLRAVMNSDRGPEQRAIEARYPGGAFFELMGHMTDRTVDLLGRPNKIQSWLRHDTEMDDDLADNTLAVFEYDQALALISSAAKMPNASEHRSFELIGTDGSLFIQPLSGNRTMHVNLRRARGPYKAGWQELRFEPHPYDVYEFKDFARAIRTGEPLQFSYDHELLVHETLVRASGHI